MNRAPESTSYVQSSQNKAQARKITNREMAAGKEFRVPLSTDDYTEFVKPSVDMRIGADLDKHKNERPIQYARPSDYEASTVVPIRSKPEGDEVERTVLIKYLGTNKDIQEQKGQIITFLRHLGSVRGKIKHSSGWFEYTFLSVRELDNLYDSTPPHENVLWMDFKSGIGIKYIPKRDEY